eukprot:NODE_19_length_39463_cov_0.396073.p30 type:complete len:102 gc:universal NODE_19_length_39463_cov_0.396073:35715-36020(+)
MVKTLSEYSKAFINQTCNKVFNLKDYCIRHTYTSCHYEVDGDHMAARKILLRYKHLYSMTPQSSVSKHYKEATRFIRFSMENLEFLINQEKFTDTNLLHYL